MDIRVFAPMLGLDPDSPWGGEIFDVEILTRLAQAGIKIEVLLRKNQPSPQVKNLTVHYLPFNIDTRVYSIFFLPWLFNIPFVKRIMKNCDIFRVHSPYFMALGAILTKTCPLWFHYFHIEKNKFMNVFDRTIPKYANGLTLLCKDTLNDLKKLCPGIENKIYEITPPGIDTNLFRPVRSNVRDELGIKDKLVVLFIGRLIERKGVDILLKAWEKVSREIDNVHLVIIGKGPLETLVKLYSKKLRNITHISFIEKRIDLPKYYSLADIFVFPTRLEGFGMTAGEAMACGLPVVTTNAKGIKHVVDSSCGFKVRVGDYNSLAEKILILLKDDRLRSTMSKNAIKKVRKEFSWDVTVNKTVNFIKKVIENA